MKEEEATRCLELGAEVPNVNSTGEVKGPCVSPSPGRKRGVAHWRLEVRLTTPSIVGPTGEGG